MSKKLDYDRLLMARSASLKERLAKHEHEKHSEKSLRYYTAGYEAAWHDLLVLMMMEKS